MTKLLKFAVALAGILLAGVLASSPAGAAERFLNGPVAVQAEPELSSPSGAFEVVEAQTGEAVAVWGQQSGLWISVRLPGQGFGAPVLAVPGQAFSANPELAITPDGYTVMVYRVSVNGTSQVMRAVRQPGASNFGAPVQVSDEDFAIPNIDAQVAIENDREALIVWKGRDIEGDENSTRVRKRYLDSEGDPSTAISNVSPVSATGVASPKAFMGPTGYALVTWVNGDTINGDPATCWMEPLGGSPDVQVFDTNSGSSMQGAVDAAGNAVIANRVGSGLVGNSRPAGIGQNFVFDQALNLPGTGSFSPQVRMDDEGVTTIASGYYVNGIEGVQVVKRPAGSGQVFGTAEQVVPESDELRELALGLGADGTAVITFVREDDRVYAAARDAGAAEFGPTVGPVSPAGVETGISLATADGLGKGLVLYSTFDVPADDFTLSALPYDDVPVADSVSIPATAVAGQPVDFSVQPVDPWAAVTVAAWELDPGVTKTGTHVAHTYTTPGQRNVSLKLTDALGNETTVTGSIDVTPAVVPPPPPPPDGVAPKLTAVSMLRKKSKRGQKNAFRFTLSERARVEISVKRTSRGRGKRAQGKIVRPGLEAGRRSVAFRGKVNRRRLKPARYRATLIAIDAAGNRSAPRHLAFRIIR